MAILLDLPIELLQQIAGSLTYRSWQNLALVNRELHNSCMSKFTLYNVARYGFQNDSAATQHLAEIYSPPKRTIIGPEQVEWPQGDKYLKSADPLTLKRIAAAVDRCLENSLNQDRDWAFIPSGQVDGDRLYEFCAWLPHLIALQHPVILALELRSLLRWKHLEIGSRSIESMEREYSRVTLSPTTANTADFKIASLGLAYLTLQRLETTTRTSEVIQQFHDVLFPAEFSITNEAFLNHTLNRDMLKRLQEWVPHYGRSEDTCSHDQALSLLLPLILGLATQFHFADHPGDLPKPSKVCLYAYMSLPPLHDFYSANEFYTWHLDKMTQPAFISGRWYGYYSVDRWHTRVVKFSAPMHTISIYASAPENHVAAARDYTALIDERSSGVDGVGQFTFQGEISRDGAVHLTKRYVHAGSTWSWTGRITPLGIVGRWGGQRRSRGYFWMWKEEWM